MESRLRGEVVRTGVMRVREKREGQSSELERAGGDLPRVRVVELGVPVRGSVPHINV